MTMDDSDPLRNPFACLVCGEIVEHADKVFNSDGNLEPLAPGLTLLCICPLTVIHAACEHAYEGPLTAIR